MVNTEPGRSIGPATRWASQSLRRLDWLLEHSLTECSAAMRSQIMIVRDEQVRLLAVLADPDADER